MKKMQTFEAFLVECGKGDKLDKKGKKKRCPECGKKMKNCCCKDENEEKDEKKED